MVEMGKYVIDMLGNVSAATLYDLKKYHRDSWQMLEKHRHEFVYSVIVKNIKNGIKEGYYRQNLKPELIARFYIAQADLMTDDKLYKETGLTKMRDVYVGNVKISHLRHSIGQRYGVFEKNIGQKKAIIPIHIQNANTTLLDVLDYQSVMKKV